MAPFPLRDAARPDQPALRLSEILSALSVALDMTEGQPAGHCMRAAYIGVRIAEELGLGSIARREVYYAILLKDLGCSSNAARLCRLYLADDLAFKRDFKFLDDSLPQVLRFVFDHTGLGHGLAERFRAIAHIMRHGGEIARELIETRCERGAKIARRLRFSEAVASSIHALDEHWNGSGKPQGLKGEAIPLYARIALAAQVADVFHQTDGAAGALRELRRRSGRWFDPTVVAAFAKVLADPGFAAEFAAADSDLPEFDTELDRVDETLLDDIAEAFGEIVDSKSPFTSGHCERVTLFADMIAEGLGLSPERRRILRRAALLHDIGKLGVSNSILEKPGKLDEEEFRVMRSHSLLGETILSRIAAFRELAEIAGAHHERLDGKGYPRGLTAAQLSLETRIVTTADIFDALTADRPYRAAMPVSKALAIMRGDLGTAIDPICLAALEEALHDFLPEEKRGELPPPLAGAVPAAA
ncbi:metal-dependent phosphohydrolase [Aureimonas endophytica]|uniref:Metal-dependent phosphohydrolase n=1 Tax=Aureimonas endophytica TaxID=2027858 RepID=A0A916ZFV8_9HYPH|nr:HD domain-containing protein [Aureimonas endophytica]GGD92843.1 metal-dependent phosphohydrolase [Aureimonas endophytica]